MQKRNVQKMGSFLFFFAIALAAASADILSEDDYKLIIDQKWFQSFYDCLMEAGPCSDEVTKFTDVIPTYLKTACESCSTNEKEMFQKEKDLVGRLYPDLYANLKDKFVPKPVSK